MKQLEIKIVKDVTIKELTCTPNVILLAKQSTTERNGEVFTSVRYIEVCNIEKTDPLTVVQN